MADPKVSVTFSSETSCCLVDLAKVTKKPVQELAEKLMKQILDEIEDMGTARIIEEYEANSKEKVVVNEEVWREILSRSVRYVCS